MVSSKALTLFLVFVMAAGAYLILAGVSAPWGAKPPGVSSQPVLQPCPDCNVIIISVEAVRKDHMSLYGYRRRTTPLLDAYAGKGVVFENAYAQAPWTKPSMASVFTSLYSFKHDVVGATDSYSIRNSPTNLAEDFSKAGFRTGAFVTISNVKSVFGFDRGFEYFNEKDVLDQRAMYVNQRVKEWVRNNTGRRIFLWVHYIDPHDPYMPPVIFNIFSNGSYNGSVKPHSEIQALDWKGCLGDVSCAINLSKDDVEYMSSFYDGELRYMDFALEDLLAFLVDEGLFNRSLIMLFADHGEEFMDHGLIYHGMSLYNEVVNVPLVVWAPGLRAGRVSKDVALVDVYPTASSFAGITPPSGIDGVDLFTGGHEYLITENYLHPRRKRAVVAGGWKLIQSSWPNGSASRELYRLSEDPRELDNVAGRYPDVARDLEHVLNSSIVGYEPVNETEARQAIDEETLRHLRSLGYIL